jgi:hypothetical protein
MCCFRRDALVFILDNVLYMETPAMKGLIFGTKGHDIRDQTLFLNPIGTLALITLFRPKVTVWTDDVLDEKYMLKYGDVVEIKDIGRLQRHSKMFNYSDITHVRICDLLHDETERDAQYIADAEILQQAYYSSTCPAHAPFSNPKLPLTNNKRLRRTMEI